MIPFDIFGVRIIYENGTQMEVRAIELMPDGFTFRVTPDMADKAVVLFEIYGFDETTYDYDCTKTRDFSLEKLEENDFYSVIKFTTCDQCFKKISKRVTDQYLAYIDAKLNHEDSYATEIYTSLGRGLDEEFPEDYELVCRELYRNISPDSLYSKLCEELNIFVTLGSDESIDKFLNCEKNEFLRWYLERHYLKTHPLTKSRLKGVILGNQFCEFLLPELEIVGKIYDMAEKNKLEMVFLTPPVRENSIKKIEKYMGEILSDKYIKIVVNDWGIADFLHKKYPACSLQLGVLLNKRRKDSRLQYMCNGEKQLEMYGVNSSNAEFYRAFLKEKLGISSFLYEPGCTCRYEEGAILFPFYQMNTSGHCVLRAVDRYCDRGHQELINSCEKICQRKHFLYPSKLGIVHRYNSLFGFDKKSLSDGTFLRQIGKMDIYLDLE